MIVRCLFIPTTLIPSPGPITVAVVSIQPGAYIGVYKPLVQLCHSVIPTSLMLVCAEEGRRSLGARLAVSHMCDSGTVRVNTCMSVCAYT